MLNSDIVKYVVEEIEAVFNKEYNIFHERIYFIVEANNGINSANLASKVKNIDINILESKNLKLAGLLKNSKHPKLIIKVIHIQKPKLITDSNKAFPFYFSFYTSALTDKSMIGTLLPIVDPTKEDLQFIKPANIIISEFNSK